MPPLLQWHSARGLGLGPPFAHPYPETIVRHQDGRIIDGRNRASVCGELGLEYPVEVYAGPEDDGILDLVLSRNLARRQLSESQRAMVAAKIATYGHGGKRKGATKAPSGALNRENVGKALNVSARSVDRAARVLASGDKKLIEKVEKGEVKVSQTARSLGPTPRKKPTRDDQAAASFSSARATACRAAGYGSSAARIVTCISPTMLTLTSGASFNSPDSLC